MAQVCTVFAQLTVRGKWEGPHVFVVRLRDDSGKPMPGVRIQDNGPKVSALPCTPFSRFVIICGIMPVVAANLQGMQAHTLQVG